MFKKLVPTAKKIHCICDTNMMVKLRNTVTDNFENEMNPRETICGELLKVAALDWNPQSAQRRGRPRKTWKKTVEEEAAVMGKIWKEVKRLANNRTRWRCFTDDLCSS
jgi:hypothetical protein